MKNLITAAVLFAAFTLSAPLCAQADTKEEALKLIKSKSAEQRLLGYQRLAPSAQENLKVFSEGFSDSDPKVLLQIIEATKNISDAKIENSLADIMNKSPHKEVQIAALGSAEKYSGNKIKKAISSALLNTAPEVRHAAAQAAGSMKLEQAVPQLKELVYDVNKPVGNAAVNALGKINTAQSRQILMEVIATADDGSVLANAIKAAAFTASQDFAAPITQILGNRPATEIYRAALDTLVKIKDPGICKLLSDELNNEDASKKSYAIYYSGTAKCAGLEKNIINFLSDSDIKNRQTAALALSRINTPSSCTALYKALDAQKDEETQGVIFSALTRCSRANNEKYLKETANSKSPFIRRKLTDYLLILQSPADIKLKQEIADLTKYPDVKEKLLK